MEAEDRWDDSAEGTMRSEWNGGVKIVSFGRTAMLPIVITGNEEQCTRKADEVRSFVESVWAMGIDAKMLRWVKR